jgi:hypothetical protein
MLKKIITVPGRKYAVFEKFCKILKCYILALYEIYIIQ